MEVLSIVLSDPAGSMSQGYWIVVQVLAWFNIANYGTKYVTGTTLVEVFRKMHQTYVMKPFSALQEGVRGLLSAAETRIVGTVFTSIRNGSELFDIQSDAIRHATGAYAKKMLEASATRLTSTTEIVSRRDGVLTGVRVRRAAGQLAEAAEARQAADAVVAARVLETEDAEKVALRARHLKLSAMARASSGKRVVPSFKKRLTGLLRYFTPLGEHGLL